MQLPTPTPPPGSSNTRTYCCMSNVHWSPSWTNNSVKMHRINSVKALSYGLLYQLRSSPWCSRGLCSGMWRRVATTVVPSRPTGPLPTTAVRSSEAQLTLYPAARRHTTEDRSANTCKLCLMSHPTPPPPKLPQLYQTRRLSSSNRYCKTPPRT